MYFVYFCPGYLNMTKFGALRKTFKPNDGVAASQQHFIVTCKTACVRTLKKIHSHFTKPHFIGRKNCFEKCIILLLL